MLYEVITVVTDFERIKRAVKSLVPETVEIAIKISNDISLFDNKEWYKLSVTPIFLREHSLISCVAYNEDKSSYALLWSAENITARKNIRITSYNVCYTKLLRTSHQSARRKSI